MDDDELDGWGGADDSTGPHAMVFPVFVFLEYFSLIRTPRFRGDDGEQVVFDLAGRRERTGGVGADNDSEAIEFPFPRSSRHPALHLSRPGTRTQVLCSYDDTSQSTS